MNETPTSTLPRRTVLATGAAGTALGVLPAGAADARRGKKKGKGGPRAKHPVFQHGVASGDPLPHAVVLWTRVTPTPAATPGSGKGGKVTVRWEVATDKRFRRVVSTGRFVTSRGRDHTVKLDAKGLKPERWYYYRFHALGQTSPVGRTRSAPAEDATPENLRIGFTSCRNWPAGLFAAYRGLAQRDDLHAVVHLGDYLYESGSSNVRAHEPDHEIVTLADYRTRHGQYKTDPDLQAAHANAPWIVTWDDHEVTNDSYATGAENHQPGPVDEGGEGDYAKRRARAHRAYDEWMPARMDGTARLGDGTRLYRRLRFGTLAELSMLDLRTYRDQQISDPGYDTGVDDPERTITGEPQMEWLLEGLAQERAQWKVVGTSVMFSPLKVAALPRDVAGAINTLAPLIPQDGVYANPDQWDGYTADRRTVVEHLAANGVQDTVFLTGDIHSGWACELPLDTSTQPLYGDSYGVEFVCSSVTSNNLKDITGAPQLTPLVETAILANNRHIKYLDFDNHGYSVLDITPERAQMDWYVIGARDDANTPIEWSTSYETIAGTGRVTAVDAPVEA